MNWYEFSQTNSYGRFEGPAVYVYVQAKDAEEANERAQELGIYFDGVRRGIDCECCGNRWDPTADYFAYSGVLAMAKRRAEASIDWACCPYWKKDGVDGYMLFYFHDGRKLLLDTPKDVLDMDCEEGLC